MEHKTNLFFIAIVIVISLTVESFAQEIKNPVIQLSGYIIDASDNKPVPGVHLFVPKQKRGTTSNISGYFTLPLLKGDTLLITCVGYKTRKYTVPTNIENGIITYFEMVRDVTKLKEVVISPWPTEELFKYAFLNLKLPEHNLYRSALNEEILNMVAVKTFSDGQSSYRSYQELLMHDYNRQLSYQPNALMIFTNPISWYKTVRAVKRGDFSKRKKRQKERKNKYQSY